ncbi:phospholipase D family protein [Halomonas sp. PAMB 3264]|uniref:phospholipase D family protein n=1 Tax=Halomonas sp. PAMB 3264 TaxID=3075222 RepID=UPI00289F5077|nr:phospholipase D family protein [Halomonas sp. PAMB 3264]WNL42144.1 phospholipase D family protein [Halomonas sp. PAMB 3264]
MASRRPWLAALLVAALTLAGCVDEDVPREAQVAVERAQAEDTWLGERVARALKGQSAPDGFALLANGQQAFETRVELIHRAERSLDIQTYLFGDGQTTRLVMEELIEAAERGVRVRLLLDDMGAIGQGERLAALSSHPRIEVRVFNPVAFGRGHLATRVLASFTAPKTQHRRMHNKLWIADNTVGIVGGRNLGDEYFDANESLNFADLDLVTIGQVVPELSQSFDDYWNHALAQPIARYHSVEASAWQPFADELDRWLDDNAEADYLVRLRESPSEAPPWRTLFWGSAQAFWDSPDKIHSDGAPHWQATLLGELLRHAESRERLVMISAYFVPTEAGVERLEALAGQGVAIDIITNSLASTDAAVVHGAYMPWRARLIESGVRLFELRPEQEASGNATAEEMRVPGASASALHIKALGFDDQVFIGSFNVDPRSVFWNTEVGVLVESDGLREAFDELVEIGQQPTISYRVTLEDGALGWAYEHEGERRRAVEEPGSWWRHANAWFSRTFHLEPLL